MREKVFVSELSASIPWLSEQIGSTAYWLKIPDSIGGGNARVSMPKGFDSILVARGVFYALEAKLSRDRTVPFSVLRDAQDDHLSMVADAGGRAFVVVNFRMNLSKKDAERRGEGKTISTYAVSIQDWRRFSAGTQRSIPLETWETATIRLPKIRLTDGKIGWDLRPLLEHVPSNLPPAELHEQLVLPR